MHFHQTINYMPGIHTIARKNELGFRLNKMQEHSPNEYQFHPDTWMLPEEYSQLRKHMEGPGKGSTYIVKPEADCQGRGIYLVNRLDGI
jgi:tubulin polyglutamylase TTLL6/13